MKSQDEIRRKISCNNLNTNNAILTNPLKMPSNINNNNYNANCTVEKRKSSVSQQKGKKTNRMYTDQLDTRGSATINFKNLKNVQKVTKQGIQINCKNKQQQVVANNNGGLEQGISINVNIQNMLPKNNNNQRTQRSLSRCHKEEDKKNKNNKIKDNSLIEEFKCIEQLECLRIEKRNQKKPLICGKNINGIEKIKLDKIEFNSIKSKNINNNDKNKIQREIKYFQEKEYTINFQFQNQALIFLDYQQNIYAIDPLYIEKKQKNFTWLMRAVLMDWIMHVCFQFSLKRQTYNIAMTLVDNYLERMNNLPKSQFQLLGAATMFIATKLQELQATRSEQFQKSTTKAYPAAQIRAAEQKLCKVLKFHLNPPTINMWANKLMAQWDTFLEQTQAIRHPFFHEKQPLFFKKVDQKAYHNFRILMQLIDCAMLDIQSMQYRPKLLICSFMYLVLGKQLGEFKCKQIVAQFPRSSLYLLDDNSIYALYNDLFQGFILSSFGFTLIDLLPSVQYSATYFILPFTSQQPIIKEQLKQEINLEEYCAYQTYNINSLQTIKKRHRGIY